MSSHSMQRCIAATALAAMLVSAVQAQEPEPEAYHRVLNHVEVVPIAGPLAGVFFDISVGWEVVAIRAQNPNDLTTEVALLVNGVEITSSTVPMPLDPPDPGGLVTCGDLPPTDDNPCHGSCPPCQGFIGVCGVKWIPPVPPPPEPPPDCGPTDCDEPCPGGDTGELVPRAIKCVCTYVISTPFPGNFLAAGDKVTVELRTTAGALAETYTGDDNLSFIVPTGMVASRVTRLSGPGCSPACPADIAPPGGDGQVDTLDFLELLAMWGVCP